MVRKISLLTLLSYFSLSMQAQTNPAILSWLQNNSVLGSYYMQGNSVALSNNTLVNVQTVQYSANWVYVSTQGIPSYPTGPFLDGNPSQATARNAIFKIPLNPVQNPGTPTNTSPGNIGIFVNGVALFDYRDGVSWKNSTNSLAGGPGGGMGDNVWNRDAIVAERAGFDCSKGHPAMGNYHHHQNPSAFKLDLVVISNICNLYDADGLYVIDSTQHSPLIGFAYDGFPIYGAYAFKEVNGTGAIVRMQSSYQLRNITTRTTYANGSTVTPGPPVSSTYPLGYFREDYEYIAHPSEPEFLDEHNGRFCITPEYPAGTYAYFCTVNENWNSAYPYAVGPTFYGTKVASSVTSITEAVTQYSPVTSSISESDFEELNVSVYPNPAGDLIAVQIKGLLKEDLIVKLFDLSGKLIAESGITKGSTIAYFDTRTYYSGMYLLKVSKGDMELSRKVSINRN
ncbi:MAG: YHYH protein [Bacteroidetes bacterium]|nr:MAG: YHYH protein [Bacteroidota bacterium]